MANDTGTRSDRRKKALSIAFGLLVLAALVAVILRHRHEFAAAVGNAPVWVLVVTTALQLLALLARTEAWHICTGAAGSTVTRRSLYRAAGFGYLGSQLNAQVGAAARIAVLRKAHPDDAPRIPALIAAEAPILVVEAMFGALAFFTLVGPLGLPWWVPIVVLVVVGVVWKLLGRLAHKEGDSWRTGLAVLSHMQGRTRTIAVMSVAIVSQIVRNWMMLHAVGVDASLLDATAVLIAMAVFAQLPVGPSVGAASVVVILGSGGVAAAAAAGVLLTATGALGALIYVAWAALDAAWVRTAGARAAEEPQGETEDRAARLGDRVEPAGTPVAPHS